MAELRSAIFWVLNCPIYQFLINGYKHMDLRVLIVLGPIVLVAAWAAFNLGKAVIKGEASLFGKQGNNPFQ